VKGWLEFKRWWNKHWRAIPREERPVNPREAKLHKLLVQKLDAKTDMPFNFRYQRSYTDLIVLTDENQSSPASSRPGSISLPVEDNSFEHESRENTRRDNFGVRLSEKYRNFRLVRPIRSSPAVGVDSEEVQIDPTIELSVDTNTGDIYQDSSLYDESFVVTPLGGFHRGSIGNKESWVPFSYSEKPSNSNLNHDSDVLSLLNRNSYDGYDGSNTRSPPHDSRKNFRHSMKALGSSVIAINRDELSNRRHSLSLVQLGANSGDISIGLSASSVLHESGTPFHQYDRETDSVRSGFISYDDMSERSSIQSSYSGGTIESDKNNNV